MRLHLSFKPFRSSSCLLTLIFTGLILALGALYRYLESEQVSLDVTSYAPVACIGPRKVLLSNSADDRLKTSQLEYTYPDTLGGSYDALGLEQTWITANDRFGPHGHGENHPEYSRSRVDWEVIDWASLQDDCLAVNKHRFRGATELMSPSKLSPSGWIARLKLTMQTKPSARPSITTGRTAIVIRSWSGHTYGQQDMIFLRSLIVEAALSSGSEYAVYLLIDVKEQGKEMYSSEADYRSVLEELVPKEFQSIAVLFNGQLLESWYPKVGEHAQIFQAFQPLQIFAQLYNQYDHYWNLEIDVRFTGHTLNYLEALSRFAKAEPRKQAFERASFRYMPAVHGTYTDFFSSINDSISGQGLWHPPHIPEIASPIGPPPPKPNPIDDNFSWGRGEHADFIPTVPCSNVNSEPRWFGKSYIFGFNLGQNTPRFFCPQAVARVSWNLLNAIHMSQAVDGVRVPSEATLPSWTYWHGLKISSPPQPWVVDPPQTPSHMDEMLNGGPPRAEWNGFANGTTSWNDTAFAEFYTMHPSWRWASLLPAKIMQAWLEPDGDNGELPYLLRRHEGKVYAPNLALHPFKTEGNL